MNSEFPSVVVRRHTRTTYVCVSVHIHTYRISCNFCGMKILQIAVWLRISHLYFMNGNLIVYTECAFARIFFCKGRKPHKIHKNEVL